MNSKQFTLRFRLSRFGQRILSALYPESRPMCALCHRPIGEAEVPGSTQGPLVRIRKESETHVLDGVCLFCLQDVQRCSFQSWTGTMKLVIAPSNVKDAENSMKTGSPGIGERPVFSSGSFARQTVISAPLLCAVTYEGIFRDTIRHWKYDGRIEFTHYLAALLFGVLKNQAEYRNNQWDCLTGVPVSADRFRKRGYHHVGLLGEELHTLLNLPYEEILCRHSSASFTQSQTTRNRKERRLSLKGQYEVKQGVEAGGKNVILLDDVITTGATMSACAEVLLTAGARHVFCVAVAHVE